MFTSLNKYKTGICSVEGCSPYEQEGSKVGKAFRCNFHHTQFKQEIALEKQKRKNALRSDGTKVRKLGKEMRTEGIVDDFMELVQDADRLFSRFVRLRDMGKDEKCTCISCGVRKDWKKMHCGHYASRSNIGIRFEELNGNSQCPYCNCNLHGNLELYAENLEKIHPGSVSWLEEQARMVSKPSKDELKQIISNLQFKVNQIEKAKGLKP